MEIGLLGMRCGECPIIDFCNDYESTPPCEQPRLEHVDTDDFTRCADVSTGSNADEIIDNAYERLKYGL